MTTTTPATLAFLERPAAATAEPWLLVLMHGVGSNEQDLFGLAPHVPPQFHVISLRGPFVLGQGSYAWFRFSVAPDGSRRIDQAQEAASRAAIAQAVQAAAGRLGVPPSRVVLGGFSQGGIMSLSLLLTQPELLQAAMVLHSRLLPEIAPFAAPAAALEGRQLWVSHGQQDPVSPRAEARAIQAHAAGLPLALRYGEYPGGHEIRPEELRQAMQWLEALVAA
jgi:phospholipase/carboxylesterase